MKPIHAAVTLGVLLGACALMSGVLRAAEGAKPHLPVTLRDAAGKPINPGDANAQPYSPRTTCGGCHPYDTIAKAYHFQMGADRMSDSFGAKQGKPWILSEGMCGRQFHMPYEWLTRKKNASAAEIGMTPFRFAQSCAACHPGGGLMERDRDGQRYDARQAAHPELASSLDGDYHKAAWDKSGVLEVDCLMCHQRGYNGQARTAQLKAGNLKWAATAGAGLGTVTGAVNAGETPTLTYDATRFANGDMKAEIGDPEDRNCLLCHEEAETKKRGHTWDGRNQDVHTAADLKCIACHRSKLDHQFAKGRANGVVLLDRMDSAEVSCAGCHNAKRLGARKPAHRMLPADHLKKIACVTCHVREANVTAVHTVDTTTGKTMGVPTSLKAKKYGESHAWTPAYFRLKDGKLYSGNALLPAWWGNRVGGVIQPLFLSETGKAYQSVKEQIRDDDGDGKVEANTDAEIGAMLTALRETLKGGRFQQISPAFVKGNRIYEMKQGRVVSAPGPEAAPVQWTFSHNVSPAKRAWGAGGCTDCHSANSTFFNSPVVVDPFDAEGRQVTVPMWQHVGLKEKAILAGQAR